MCMCLEVCRCAFPAVIYLFVIVGGCVCACLHGHCSALFKDTEAGTYAQTCTQQSSSPQAEYGQVAGSHPLYGTGGATSCRSPCCTAWTAMGQRCGVVHAWMVVHAKAVHAEP